MDVRGQELRRQFYEMVKRHAESRLGTPPIELKKYQQSFDKELEGIWKPSEIEVLLESIAKTDILLLGDFHGLKQSQKSHLRLLKKIKTLVKMQRRQLVVGLECLEVKDTAYLNKYLAGEISESVFLEKVQWYAKWGFPWDHYRPLIHWIHENGGILYGINKASLKVMRTDLKLRDQAVGKSISKILKKHEDDLIVVVFGEMHLAKGHLIKEIVSHSKKVPPKILRIFQNPEELYFKFLKSGSKIPQLAHKNRTTFAVLNVPPWVKWQSYLIYLEQSQDLGMHDEDEWDDESDWDFSDEVAQMARILATDLKLPFKENRLAVTTLEEGGFETALKRKKTSQEKKILRLFIRQEIPFLLPESDMVYLPRMSVNHAAQAAMLFLVFADHRDLKVPWKLPEDFLKLIWVLSWIYFGSKLLNPRRKTDTFKDLKIRLASQDEKGRGKDALKIALYQKSRELSGQFSSASRITAPPAAKNIEALIIAAELLGKIHGEKLYAGWIQRKFSRDWIHTSLKSSLKPNTLARTYYSMVKKLEGISLDFTSKAEKI